MENNLKELRVANGMSLQALGDLCGISKAHIHCLEKGNNQPTLSTAYVIANIFNITVYDIWPDTTEVVEETITVRRIANTKGAAR